MTLSPHIEPGGVNLTDFLSGGKAAELARDIVAQIDGASNLAQAYGLTPEQWVLLRANHHFRTLVSRAKTDLSGPTGTAELARRKAALAIEQNGILDMSEIMSDKGANANHRIAAYEQLLLTAQMGKNAPQAANPGGIGGPLIVIQFKDRSMSIGTALPEQPAIEGTAERIA